MVAPDAVTLPEQANAPDPAPRPASAAYWRARLAGLGEKSCPVADLAPPPGAPRARASHVVALAAPLARRLDEMSRHEPTALHVLLATALAALLRRHATGDEVVLGQPVPLPAAGGANRMLVLRVDVAADDTYRALLMRMRTLVREALEHADFPVAELAVELGRATSPAGAAGDPCADDPYLDVAIELAGLHDPRFAADVPVRLLLSVTRAGEALDVELRYDASRFLPASIERFALHYVALLEAVTGDPDRPLAGIDLRTAWDHAIAAASNDTATAIDEGATVHGLLARQAALTPDAVAVTAQGGQMTYAELDERSDRLARTLRARGVGADVVVGVLADRSVEMVVAVLAVLKAGGAYLPLDPAYPSARIAQLIGDSRTRLVLARAAVARDLAPGVGSAGVLDLDAAESYEPATGSLPAVGPRDLAYVIYTSGSTGEPKGVMVEHRSVVNRLAWMQRAYPIGAGDVILQKTSISFDVSVWELFWWAATGATLALLEPGGEKDPAAIAAAIERHGVTTMHFVPSMLGMFLAHAERFGAAGRLTSLRQVFTSGEELGRDQVRRLAGLVPGARIVNLYGPTEATVDVTHYPCDELGAQARVPIGRPIDNIRLHVLDEERRPVPVGVPGELYVAGAGVARGYLHRPELTAERFVEDGPVAGERLYRTGDRARLLADGTLDFLGRVDRQVKVRGFRVEPGEIEERLRAHPRVRDAAVIATADGWQTSLHGFVVMRDAADAVPEQELKAHLRETLPEHMVPSRVLVLHELPLTPNGKLDRAALARPDLRQRLVVQHVPPRDERERALAAIWSEVLGAPRVGMMDNFFALGGNSIHFVAVLAKARAAGLRFTFQQLFRHQTVAALAAAIAAEEQRTDVADAVQAERGAHRPFDLISPEDRAKLPDDVEDAYPLSMLQAGLIFQTEVTGGLGQYHDVLGYLIRAPFDAAAFEEAVRTMVRRHPVLRTTYHLTGYREFLQLVRREVPLPLTVVDLRDRDRAAQEAYDAEWVAQEKARRFDWEEGGLVRIHVQILADDLFRYTVSQHNSALDGWSISLLHTQLFELYFALRDGRTAESRDVDNHLRNFVALEQEAVASPESRGFWTRVLEGTTSTEVPRRPGARETADFSVAMHDVDLPAGLTERVVALADALSVPVKDVLLAAHVKVLATVSGEREVLTGYEHSGRPELPDAEAALGLFLNTVPLRVRLTDGSWAQLVRDVYQAELDLLPHRRYPMARMKQDLATQRTLFETTFNYTHFYLLKRLRELPEFALLDMRVDSETEFVLRTEVSRHFFDDDIRLCLHYHAHLFDAEQIDRIGGYFVRALELMTSEPSAPHDARPLSGPAEQQRLRELAARGLDAVDGPDGWRAPAGAAGPAGPADVAAVHVLDA
ncbi:MAG: amino acid adenylation domain-containing protein, partial [Frankiaceae bacterium]